MYQPNRMKKTICTFNRFHNHKLNNENISPAKIHVELVKGKTVGTSEGKNFYLQQYETQVGCEECCLLSSLLTTAPPLRSKGLTSIDDLR